VRRRPELWPNDCILHHDNAPAHKALSVKQFLAQKSITEMEHPPCSPDLAPNDFWLFPEIKSALKGRRFQVTERVEENVTTALKAVPQQEF
jgi:transposase